MKKVDKILTLMINVYKDIIEFDHTHNHLNDRIKEIGQHIKEQNYDKDFIINTLLQEKAFLDEILIDKLSDEELELIIDDYTLISAYYNRIVKYGVIDDNE